MSDMAIGASMNTATIHQGETAVIGSRFLQVENSNPFEPTT